jgi:hypothetical protein
MGGLGSDFTRMGRAIEQRYERCAGWWRRHLELTSSFIATRAPQAASVAVLGAGRLLDIDVGGLLSRCCTVHLFDADPSAVSRWRRVCGREYGKRVIGHTVDLTDTMQVWTKGLAAAIRTDSLREFLDSCVAPVPAWAHEKFDGYISLNILGQIPLYWRDRVVGSAGALSGEQWLALEGAMGRLQVAHMQGLELRPSAWSILVTDTEYYFYQGDQSEWRVEPALYGSAQAAYEAHVARGVDVTWLWHIAPQFVEADDEGEIHRVEASVRV